MALRLFPFLGCSTKSCLVVWKDSGRSITKKSMGFPTAIGAGEVKMMICMSGEGIVFICSISVIEKLLIFHSDTATAVSVRNVIIAAAKARTEHSYNLAYL